MTSATMTHNTAREMLGAEALDALDAGERALLAEHLRGCPQCQRSLGSYRVVSAALAQLPAAEPLDRFKSARLRERIVAQATAAEPAPDIRPVSGGQSRRMTRGISSRWTGWLVAAGMAGLVLTHHAFHRPLQAGWLAAAAFGLALVGLGAYTVVLRQRLGAARQRTGPGRATE